jgi:hypothetical protein
MREYRPTTKINLHCGSCPYTARRSLLLTTARRGIHEAPAEPSLCPQGHGILHRNDGLRDDGVASFNQAWFEVPNHPS